MPARKRITRIRFCEHCGIDCSWGARWCPECQLAIGEPIRHRVAALQGVTERNRDGRPRQDLLRSIRGGDGAALDVTLVREQDEVHDESVIAVECVHGRLGYLSRDLSASVVRTQEAGCRATGVLLRIEPLESHDFPAGTLGGDVILVQMAPTVTEDELELRVSAVREGA